MRHCTCRLVVRGYELDSFGHVNNAVYLQYGEHAIWNFMKQSGLLGEITDSGLHPVIMESSLRYLHELQLLDEVRIESDFTCTGKKMHVVHHIIRESTGQTACKIKSKIMMVSRDRMIHDIPESLFHYTECDTNENETNAICDGDL
jgi:acyl-CoA thioester hydrolase